MDIAALLGTLIVLSNRRKTEKYFIHSHITNFLDENEIANACSFLDGVETINYSVMCVYSKDP